MPILELLFKLLEKLFQSLYPNTHRLQLCMKHFYDNDALKKDILPDRDGSTDKDIVISRNKFQLKKEAVPCIFPNLVSFVSKRNSRKP